MGVDRDKWLYCEQYSLRFGALLSGVPDADLDLDRDEDTAARASHGRATATAQQTLITCMMDSNVTGWYHCQLERQG